MVEARDLNFHIESSQDGLSKVPREFLVRTKARIATLEAQLAETQEKLIEANDKLIRQNEALKAAMTPGRQALASKGGEE